MPQFRKSKQYKQMKKIFTKEFTSQFIIQILFTGIIIFCFQTYINSVSTPMTAAETLKKENFLNSKRDTYFQALDLLNRNLSNTNFTMNGILSDTINRTRGGNYPTELEVNSCFSKLCIYSDDENIPIIFQKMFVSDSKSRPILEMLTFVKLVRKDLGYGDTKIDSIGDRYKFISIIRPK